MTARGINRLSPDSIQNVEDMRDWARGHEIYTEQEMDQMSATIYELREVNEGHKIKIVRNLRLIIVMSVGVCIVLCVLVFGVFQRSSGGSVSYEQDRLEQQEYMYPAKLTLKDVAEKVGVHKDTIIRWITAGKVDVPKRKNKQGHYRFSEKDLEVLQRYAERREFYK